MEGLFLLKGVQPVVQDPFPGRSPFRSSNVTVFVISWAFGVISLSAYLDAWLQLGIAGLFGKLIEAYRTALQQWFGWLDPWARDLARYVGRIFKIELAFYPHWKEIFVPAFFYLVRVALINWQMNRKLYSIALAFWGLTVALTLSLASGTAPLDDPYLRTLLFPVAGFVVYEVVTAFLTATMVGFQQDPWWRVFMFYFQKRVVTVIMLSVLLVAYAFWSTAATVPGVTAVFVVVFVALIAVRDILIAIWVAMRHPRLPQQTRFNKLRSQANFWIGCTTLSIVLTTLGLVLWQTGGG